jgi:hypothetical protein
VGKDEGKVGGFLVGAPALTGKVDNPPPAGGFTFTVISSSTVVAGVAFPLPCGGAGAGPAIGGGATLI